MLAASVAAVCAVGAVVVVTSMVAGGPSSLLQRGLVKLAPVKGMRPLQAVGGKARQGADQVYYVPMKNVKASPLGQLASKSAAAQPVVYYYMPEKAAAKQGAVHVAQTHQMLDDNATAAGGAAEAKFVCSVDNIKALYEPTQAKWAACADLKDYKPPNAAEGGAAAASGGDAAASDAASGEEDAARRRRRRLLGWVWEPKTGEKKTPLPAHGPAYYKLKLSEQDRAHAHTKQVTLRQTVHPAVHPVHPQMLDDNATAGGGDAKVQTFDECQKAAMEDVCSKLASCSDPVCDNYYNEPEIESLCGMCTMAPLGCFAASAEAYIQGKGTVKVQDLQIGDKVLAASADGKAISSEVIFMHDHKDVSTTVQVYITDDMMELTPAHMVALHTESCGLEYCSDAELVPAKEIRAGDKIYVSDGTSTAVQTVTAVSKAASKVRYVVTSDDTIVVNGVVASVFSTGANSIETLPFHLLHKFAKGTLQWGPIAASLEVILEAPVLRAFEALVNAVAGLKAPKASAAALRFSAAPQASY